MKKQLTQPASKQAMRRHVKAEHVERELLPGCSKELLQALHLLTRQGDLNADALRKLKQVNHLVRLLSPAMDDILARHKSPVIVDCGAGKSCLGFILYELFFKNIDASLSESEATAVVPQVWSIESRAELSQSAESLAKQLGFAHMQFAAAALDDAALPLPERLHLVTALHACDTATDDAIALAIRRRADHVAVVPCCQAEVARQLDAARKANTSDHVMRTLHEHPWHRREFGSHLTNVIRALCLEAHGYQVTVTELAGWEHALKNELILGKRIQNESRAAREKLDALVAATGVQPKLLRLLNDVQATSAST